MPIQDRRCVIHRNSADMALEWNYFESAITYGLTVRETFDALSREVIVPGCACCAFAKEIGIVNVYCVWHPFACVPILMSSIGRLTFNGFT